MRYIYLFLMFMIMAAAPAVSNAKEGAKRMEAGKVVKAVIETKYGNMEIRLFPEVAPGHVENFVKLAKEGFYDGTIFHRVIPGFMIQGGDPLTKGEDKSVYGTGGPGWDGEGGVNDKRGTRGSPAVAEASAPA